MYEIFKNVIKIFGPPEIRPWCQICYSAYNYPKIRTAGVYIVPYSPPPMGGNDFARGEAFQKYKKRGKKKEKRKQGKRGDGKKRRGKIKRKKGI